MDAFNDILLEINKIVWNDILVAKKKLHREIEEEAKAEELRPKLEAILKPFLFGPDTIEGLNDLSKTMLQDLIQNYYKKKPTGLRTMKKADLVVTLACLVLRGVSTVLVCVCIYFIFD